MFDKRTVFILGAGASVPYKYPVGNALYNQIVEEQDLSMVSNAVYIKMQERARKANIHFMASPQEMQEEIQEYIRTFQDKMLKAKAPSIDYYLELRTKDLVTEEEKHRISGKR